MNAHSEIRLDGPTWTSCYVIHCETRRRSPRLRELKDRPQKDRRKPRNVNACARGISLTRASRSGGESEARKSAMYTDTHGTRGVTVHVRVVTPVHAPA